MAASCCHPDPASPAAAAPTSPAYRRVLWAALLINATMFGIELAGGVRADSVSLLADAIDFFGDAANYAVSLFVLGMAASTRARAALFKGATMGMYGVFVLAKAGFAAALGSVPEPTTIAQARGELKVAAA